MAMHEYWTALKRVRLDRGFTQEWVADQLGRHRTTVARHEDGSMAMTVGELQQYLDLYGASMSDLFEPDGSPAYKAMTHDQLMTRLKNITPFLRTEDLRAILQMAALLTGRDGSKERQRAPRQK